MVQIVTKNKFFTLQKQSFSVFSWFFDILCTNFAVANKKNRRISPYQQWQTNPLAFTFFITLQKLRSGMSCAKNQRTKDHKTPLPQTGGGVFIDKGRLI